ncbi:PREDICTED: uncharacterized protein LOC103340515 [Prunus mume]|uniref:Uncharacterized protein LOC103340515 n=1 Tax=Prunus mume TaxID=102107 RepID=A0ABM0PNI9_PRUMU|nr:PREDICTED: uncharacterized protein LOC103340515 [Prunus mume]
MGVIKHGLGSWSTIAKEFVSTKTPHQVAIYAESCFLRLQKPFLYNLGIERTKQLPTIIPPREMDLNLPPPDDYSSSSKPPVPAASGSNSMAPQKLDKYTSLFFPPEASSDERSAKTTPPVKPEKPVSLRALAEEPEPIKISLALPEFERDNEMEEEGLNLELTLGRGGTS